jgi:hypothetical protein
MGSIIEFLMVFFLTISLIFILVLPTQKILNMVQQTTNYYFTAYSLSNLSLFAGISYTYSGALSYEFVQKNFSFAILGQKIKSDIFSVETIASLFGGGTIEKSNKIPT